MYGVLREYEVGSSVIDELVRHAEETFVPSLCETPGFISYTMLEDAEIQSLVTLSIFEERAGAEESIRLAADWVRTYVTALLPMPPRHTIGKFAVGNFHDFAAGGYFFMRRYTLLPGNVEPFASRVGAGLVPALSARPGFVGYGLLDAARGRVVSLSAFADSHSAHAAHEFALTWVHRNLSALIMDPPDISMATVKLHRGRSAAAVM